MTRSTKETQRLDRFLIEQGYVADLKGATGLIMAGRVVCDGVVVDKPGHPTKSDAIIHLRGERLKYASRGGYKLEHALRSFGVTVGDRVALDAGASTGGFTDCLLQAGARKVYAVDVGYGQLRGSLAANPRVEVRERTNIGALSRESFTEPLELAVVDLSYLSLLTAIPIVGACFQGPLQAICLFKPLYEGLARETMSDPGALERVLEKFFIELESSAYRVEDVVVSPILGGNAAVEFLFQVGQGPARETPSTLARRAIESYRATPPVPSFSL